VLDFHGARYKAESLSAGYLPTLFDFHFDGAQQKWVPWSSLVGSYIHDPEVKFIHVLGMAQRLKFT
jgi:hypothetical protein